MMSQRAGTLSYLTFSAGFSLVAYVLFYIVCDVWKWRSSFLQTFGTNALAAYVLHGMVSSAVKPFVPRDAPGWYVTAGLLLFFGVTWVIVRHLEKQKIYIRV
jgi:fucose 4-O-acetylase-like acetyltransferase